MTTINAKNEADFLASTHTLKVEMFDKMCNTILANYNKLANDNLTYQKSNYSTVSKTQPALTALFDKLNHITFNLFSPQSIPGFLNRIATKPVKVISKPGYHYGPDSDDPAEIYGIGHFRWDWKAYTLNENELQAIRIYLGLHVKESKKISTTVNKNVASWEQFKNETDYQKRAELFLTITGTTFSTEFKEHTTYFDGDRETRDIYTCTLKNANSRYRFTFGQSINNTGTRPTAADVLASITKYDCGTFSDFCGEFGYEEDSRSAYKTYKTVMKEWKNIELLFTVEQLEQLREIQ